MTDRPTLLELIEAVQIHLETQVIPAVKAEPKLYYQTLVAINVLKIAGRELKYGYEQTRAEWARLNALTGVALPLPPDPAAASAALAEREAWLYDAIRAGAFDEADRRSALLAHLLARAAGALEIANPRFLATLAEEDEARRHTEAHERGEASSNQGFK